MLAPHSYDTMIEESRKLTRRRKGYRLYKIWFINCLILFIISFTSYLYLRIFDGTNGLIVPSFMLSLIDFGCGLTALSGMYSHRDKHLLSFSLRAIGDIETPNSIKITTCDKIEN